jgi:Uma2 family endonuclease
MKSVSGARRTAAPSRRSRKTGQGQPAWDIALVFPAQGEWTEEEFLELEDNCQNRLIELDDGRLEVLPMPDPYHQGIVRYLFVRAELFLEHADLGEMFFAPLPIRLWLGQMREPDLVFLKKERLKNRRKPPDGADLVMEVVSKGKRNRQRDLTTKRKIYARAGISEYWIVDPQQQTITVLWLAGKSYKVLGKYRAGGQAASRVLAGFVVAVDQVFAAGEGK